MKVADVIRRHGIGEQARIAGGSVRGLAGWHFLTPKRTA